MFPMNSNNSINATNKNKTILFVYIGPFYPVLGGIERITDTLTKSFIRKGYRVLYLVFEGKVKLATTYDYPAPLFFFPNCDFHSLENIEFYHQFLKEQKVDIVINQSGSFPESKLFLNTGDADVKKISVLHCCPRMAYNHLFTEYKCFLLSRNFINKLFYIFCIVPLFPFWKLWVWLKNKNHYRFFSNKTDYVCLLSDKFKGELLSICPINENKIISIPNPNSFTLPQCPEKKKKQLIYVGRLEMIQKRPDRLLKVWGKICKEFPEWELKFIGDGKLRIWMEKEVAKKKLLRVTFEGYKPSEPYYEESSIFCLTSNFEGWGMVLTEAMQYGCVPVTFNSYRSVKDIITPGRNGMLVKPFDLNEYADKLRVLMRDNKTREKMSYNGFEDVKRFDAERVVKQWIDFFEKI